MYSIHSSKPKTALILAAGKGSRLGIQVNGTHKCLLRIAGKPLIRRMIDELKENGITKIYLVVGHEAELIKDYFKDECEYIYNERYAETNSLYSLWLAKDYIKEPFVLLNSDILAHPMIIKKLIDVPGCALTFDPSSGDQDEHMKVKFVDGKLKSIRKTLSNKDNDGESLGILKFDEDGAKLIFNCAEKAIDERGEMTWAPAAVEQLASECSIRGVDISGLPWTEIDFPEDLVHAKETIWPAIADDDDMAIHIVKKKI